MSWQTWWVFACAVFLLSGTPGPNMLHVMTRSIALGSRRSIAAMAGCLMALVLALTASAAGVSALLLAWPRVFDALRYAGVAYLLYLGVKAWRGSGDRSADVVASAVPVVPSIGRLIRGGFVIGISNPKLLLFAAAVLPQFIDRGYPRTQQFAILIATFAAIECCWFIVYAASGRTLARYLRRPVLRQAFDRATGLVFIGFGLALLVKHA